MSETMDETTAKAILSTLQEMQKTINGQQSLMMQIFRNGERVEKRVDLLERRIGGFEQRMNSLEQRISDQKDELALMIKMELGGWAANFETKLDLRFERIEQAIETMARVISPDADS